MQARGATDPPFYVRNWFSASFVLQDFLSVNSGVLLSFSGCGQSFHTKCKVENLYTYVYTSAACLSSQVYTAFTLT